MSVSEHGAAHGTAHEEGVVPPVRPTPEQVAAMSPKERGHLAANLDDVDIQHNTSTFPIPGTREEKRAERSVALWFVLSGLSALAFLGVFLFWPWEYVAPFEPGVQLYNLYTPLIGFFFGFSVLAIGIAVIQYVKKFFPAEVSVQQRHDGISDEVDRQTVIAQLQMAGADTTIGRRKMILGTAGGAAGLFGIGLGIAAIAPLVRDPWKGGDNADLWVTTWAPQEPGEVVYLRRDTGDPYQISLVRPEDMAPGALESVFPFRESEREDEEALALALRRSDTPVMLIRLRPGQPVVQREGQEDFHYGDYYAYSKICTHLGCPTSLYETQSNRILCPCHQSQFLANEFGRPVFGPATRSLPELPITVNEEGYLVARGDFREPVGPAFWERSRV